MAKFEKGKSGNPNGRPTKPSGKVLEFSINSTAQNMPDMPVAVKKSDLTISLDDWINWGSDNLFSNAIAQLNRKSPTHRGILNWLTIYLSGKGFETGDEKSAFNDWVKKCNSKGESLKKVMRKIIFDKRSSGNAFLEIVISGKTLNFYHKDYTTCRVGKDGESIKIYGDWENVKKTEVKTVALFPKFTEDGSVKRSIVHIKDYEPEFEHYGVASWISAMDAAGIAYKTNKWNISRLDNSFSSSGVLVVEGNITPAEAKKMKEQFKTEYTGEGKQGKVMMIVKQVGGGETKFQPITTNNDGEWMELHKQSEGDLLKAHNWFASLAGFNYLSGFDTNRIRNEYQIALNTIIKEEQETLLDIIRPLINEYSSFNADKLVFKNEIPISLQDLLKPEAILSKNEQRAIFGYPEVEEQITQALNGAQVDSLVNILTATANGAIPRESALNLLINAYGLTKENAEAILSTIGNGFKPKEVTNG